jgi:hypothetical protein
MRPNKLCTHAKNLAAIPFRTTRQILAHMVAPATSQSTRPFRFYGAIDSRGAVHGGDHHCTLVFEL